MRKHLFATAVLAVTLSLSGIATAMGMPAPKPFTSAELSKFVVDYPALGQWLVQQGRHFGGTHNPLVISGMRYNPNFLAQLKEKGWQSDRFFYLLDHINMGLLVTRAEQDRAEAKARLKAQLKQMNANRDIGRQRMAKAMQENQARMREQMAGQRRQIQNNAFLNPMQKRRILNQMDRNQAQMADMAKPDYGQRMNQRMQAQQKAWMVAQKQRILRNPHIPLLQKQRMVAQMDQNMNQNMNPPALPPVDVNPENMADQMRKQQEAWMNSQIQSLRNNPYMQPAQRQMAINQMKMAQKRMQESMAQAAKAHKLIPDQETELVKANREKLLDLFFPKSQ